MSHVNFMEKLLEGVEVEWNALKKVTLQTKNIKWPDTNRSYRYIDLSSVCRKRKSIIESTDISAKNAPSRAKKLVEKNDVLFATTRPTQQRFTLINNEYSGEVASTGYCVLRAKVDEILPKWIFYNISSAGFNNYVEENQSGSAYPAISDSKVKEFQIPIPPLAIQAEIVRILDAFTALTAELTAELTARKKQYNYYRDQLLTFEEGEVEWKTLGEVALEFGRGKSKHRPRNDSKLYGGDNPFIQTGDIRKASHIITAYTQTYSKFGLEQSKLWPKGTLCISIAANIAETTILGFDACFPDSVIGFIADPEKSNANFVEYLLTSFKSKLQDQSTGSAQRNIKLATFESVRFPFPPLPEQARIVTILDKFDALTHSISEGLPREIELRQKQYEYYREKLLSFPKAKIEA